MIDGERVPVESRYVVQILDDGRQAEVELGRGLRVPQVRKKLGISEQTYYWWRGWCGRGDSASRALPSVAQYSPVQFPRYFQDFLRTALLSHVG